MHQKLFSFAAFEFWETEEAGRWANPTAAKMWSSSEHFLKFTSSISQTQKFSDATILLDDGSRYKVHKCVLARDSEFFRNLFRYQAGPEYKLSKVRAKTFQTILDWIYSHRISLNTTDAFNLLEESDYLCCLELVEVTIRWLTPKVKPENVLGFQSFCIQYNIEPLSAWCQGFIEDEFSAVSQEEEFLWLSPQQLQNLFLDENISVGPQKFQEALNRWINHDEETRTELLPKILNGPVKERLCGDSSENVLLKENFDPEIGIEPRPILRKPREIPPPIQAEISDIPSEEED